MTVLAAEDDPVMLSEVGSHLDECTTGCSGKVVSCQFLSFPGSAWEREKNYFGLVMKDAARLFDQAASLS